ncbi:Uncharacterized protein LSUE1_G003708 [Lachnellula suecica]|uniref:WKF domain-containing protein n=1 Tax=Lachnellula suecica TaxID=602035 RepID=A0A8T9C8D7_9HELO|nr:Uncharacterized protein LSUE1_G003708 [Lachnellula suecica]
MPSATESDTPTRIPAWKRLGLKLKSAQDIPASPPIEPLNPKRKRPNEVKEATPLKKSKPSPNVDSLSTTAHVTPKLARKKSVTFTPETKIEDGDSIKQLFSAWKAEQNSQEDLSAPVFQTPQYQKVEEVVDPTLNEKERRVKRVKTLKQGEDESKDPEAKDSTKAKKKKKKPETPQKTPVPFKPAEHEQASKPTKQLKSKKERKPRTAKSPTTTVLPEKPFLAYLKEYTESRETWKFKKNHQSQLLKHLFNIDIIPSEYAHYIYEYVKGLQGGVRTRLRDTAIAIKVKDQEEPFPADMENSEQRKREYDVAMNEYAATMIAADMGPNVNYEEGVLLGLSDVAMPKRVAKRKRAETILAKLGSGEGEAVGGGTRPQEVEDDIQKRLRVNDGKIVRKRKQRTVLADDDSSSEDSSDESSSDEDELTQLQRDGLEDTSSSSSSSEDESESELEDSGSEDEDGSEESDSE